MVTNLSLYQRLFWLIAWLLVFISADTVLSSSVGARLPSGKIELVPTFREPKNILFSSTFGGSSHVNWVLTILDELSQRGHNITFLAGKGHEKFAKPYPHFNTIVLEGEPPNIEKTVGPKHIDVLEIVDKVFEFANENFEDAYVAHKRIMTDLGMDVVICDFGSATGCFEAAMATDKPYVVTAAFASFSDAKAPYVNNDILTMRNPTTLDMNFVDRFNDMFIKPMRALMKLVPVSKRVNKKRHAAGCYVDSLELSGTVHQNSLKIINSLFGIEAARPIGPLLEMVGPILPRFYDPLTHKLEQYLDAHRKIIYIAFGQHAAATAADKNMILTALVEAVEANAYDGFLWALRDLTGLPEAVTTVSGKVYITQDILEGAYPNMRFEKWVPQTAVLMHPSVSVFLTHGGAGSLYEGLFAGKRLIVFPFFGDQFVNAHNVQTNGMGGYLKETAPQSEANNLLIRVGQDADGSYQQSVNRYQALIQIHSRHGPIRGADLIEEVLYVNKDNRLPYRYEHKRYMSFIKAHNIDMFAIVAIILMIPVIIFIMAAQRLFKSNNKIDTTKKQKLN